MARKPQLKIDVEFSGVSIGDGTARLGLRVPVARDGVPGISVETAVLFFGGAQLDATIRLKGDQQSLPGMEAEPINCVADVKRFGYSPKWINCGLTFQLETLGRDHLAALSTFAKQPGELVAVRLGDSADDEDGDDASQMTIEEAVEKPKRRTPAPPRPSDPSALIEAGVDEASAKALADHGIDTVRKLRNALSNGKDLAAFGLDPGAVEALRNLDALVMV